MVGYKKHAAGQQNAKRESHFSCPFVPFVAIYFFAPREYSPE
jgi:hypothetical protein